MAMSRKKTLDQQTVKAEEKPENFNAMVNLSTMALNKCCNVCFEQKSEHTFVLQFQDVECGVTVGCFREPEGCSLENCDFFLSWRPDGNLVEFNVSSSQVTANTLWTAVGFSYNKQMVFVSNVSLLSS